MSAQLKEKIDQLLSSADHTSRVTEHALYNRLLYRAGNQHRHGLYFRRLQHVRRKLRALQLHPAWSSLRMALPENTTTQAKQKRRRTSTGCKNKDNDGSVVVLSTVAQSDLSELQSQLDALVTHIIPTAATSVAKHLIALEQFLPFAVTVSACLARIFVIERSIRSKVSALLVDINILFNVERQRELAAENAALVDEDVGTPVVVDTPRKRKTEADNNTAQAVVHTQPLRPSQPLVHNSADSSAAYPKRSLYAVLSSHAPPPSSMMTGPTATPRAATPRAAVDLPDLCSPPLSPRETAVSTPKPREIQEAASKKVDPRAAEPAVEQDSDSDDLDDIFGNLDD